MAGSDVGLLVSCEWLKERIDACDLDNLVILDVSWSSERDCQEEFGKRHIPGARYLNVMVGPHTELFPRNIPETEVFEEAARTAGVNEDSHVILYSDSDNHGFFLSGRAWWTFTVFGAQRLSILNGGLVKWISLGFPVTSDPTEVKKGNLTARYDARYRRRFEDMCKTVESGACILDSRSQDQYNAGHLPGAKNLPFTQLMDSAKQEMMNVANVLEKMGVDPNQPLTTYCNSGMSSSTLAFAYRLCGGKDFTLYHGGFTEWKNKAKNRVEKS